MWQTCPLCKGSGTKQQSFASEEVSNKCPVCNGEKIISELTGLPPGRSLQTPGPTVQDLTSTATGNRIYRPKGSDGDVRPTVFGPSKDNPPAKVFSIQDFFDLLPLKEQEEINNQEATTEKEMNINTKLGEPFEVKPFESVRSIMNRIEQKLFEQRFSNKTNDKI